MKLWSVEETMDGLRKHMARAGVSGKWWGSDFRKLRGGKCFEYTDTAYDILGRVAEAASGMPLAEAFNVHVYQRVGIERGDVYQAWREGPDEGIENRYSQLNP